MATDRSQPESDFLPETFYIYNSNIDKIRKQEFKRLKDVTFLDHAGTTLYPESLITSYHGDLCSHVYGNPHSNNDSSRRTAEVTHQMRNRILRHFHTSSEEYSVIFTSGATQALKIVAESFDFQGSESKGDEKSAAGVFCYLDDNHTSVVGMREIATERKVQVTCLKACVTGSDKLSTCKAVNVNKHTGHHGNGLFVYPAQSNFHGKRYPLSWIRDAHSGHLAALSSCRKVCVLLDAAAYVSTSDLDLSEHRPDFVVMSFYKMFGFPTGLGALLVRNDRCDLLKKTYFGGGTVQAAIATEDYHVKAADISHRFEDGTVPFLNIIALKHGFNSLERLAGSTSSISTHTSHLSHYLHSNLSSLRHDNGRSVVTVYTDGNYGDAVTQGPVVTFNVYDRDGKIVGYNEVENLATVYNIELRTGCFCNLGACHRHLGIDPATAKLHVKAGHVCGDGLSVINGRPTGAIRASLGYASTLADAQRLVSFISEGFCGRRRDCVTVVTGPGGVDNWAPSLERMFVYPVKSCAGFEVFEWPVSPRGLLFDRHWAVVTATGACLTQKRAPLMCRLQPSVDLQTGALTLEYGDMPPITVAPDTTSPSPSPSPSLCETRVCTDRVQSVDCGSEVAGWLERALHRPGVRLVRQEQPNNKHGRERLSLANEAQYLLINTTSVQLVRQEMTSRWQHLDLDESALLSRFRANLVVTMATAYEEDTWSGVTIGTEKLEVQGPCSRCNMICVDQTSGVRSKEPLLALLSSRNSKATFGILLSHAGSKMDALRVGQPIIPTL